MKHYQFPVSHYSAEVRIVLLEKGIEADLPPLPGGLLNCPDYRHINSPALVPRLEDGTLGPSESGLIAEYLEERYPKSMMLPPEVDARAKSRWRLRFHDLYPAPQLSLPYETTLANRRRGPEIISALSEHHSQYKILEHRLESKSPQP